MIHLVLALCFISSALSNKIADTNADLTVDVLKEGISNGGNNLVFSPASLMYGVAMLYEGLGDRSRRVVNNALNFQNENEFRTNFRVS